MIVTLALFAVTIVYMMQVLPLPMGNIVKVGPGAYPMALSVLMLACLSVVLLRDLKHKRTGQPKSMPRFLKQTGAVFVTVLFAVSLEWAGYYVSTFLYASVMSWLFSSIKSGDTQTRSFPRRLFGAALIGASITFAGYVLFHLMFGFRLP
ncbi:MAG: tripartite tricarboxylate transporter TctB family protein, partial [Thermovirgaceae bacterium]